MRKICDISGGAEVFLQGGAEAEDSIVENGSLDPIRVTLRLVAN